MRLMVVVAFSFLFTGCDSGEQRGNFVVSGSGGRALAGAGGSIVTFTGTPANNLDHPKQLLLAVLFVGSDFKTTRSSHQTLVSMEQVESPVGKFQIEWNRSSESVSIHDVKYDRAAGNIFLVRLQDGRISSQQVATINDSIETGDILAVVKRMVQNDPEIQALAE